MVTHSTTYNYSTPQLSYTSRDKQQPQIKSEGTVTNSGFRSKSVTVTYQRPVLTDTYLGEIPQNHRIFADTGFDYSILETQGKACIACSKESPNLLPWTKSTQRVYRQEAVLDAAGKPKMETITKNIKVPGTKGVILRRFAASAVMGAVGYGLFAAATVGLGLGIGFLTGGSSALWFLTKSSAVGGALLGMGETLIGDRKKLSEPVTLHWSQTDITSPGELTGYRVGFPNILGRIDGGLALYHPKFSDSTKHGEWSKPSVRWGSQELRWANNLEKQAVDI